MSSPPRLKPSQSRPLCDHRLPAASSSSQALARCDSRLLPGLVIGPLRGTPNGCRPRLLPVCRPRELRSCHPKASLPCASLPHCARQVSQPPSLPQAADVCDDPPWPLHRGADEMRPVPSLTSRRLGHTARGAKARNAYWPPGPEGGKHPWRGRRKVLPSNLAHPRAFPGAPTSEPAITSSVCVTAGKNGGVGLGVSRHGALSLERSWREQMENPHQQPAHSTCRKGPRNRKITHQEVIRCDPLTGSPSHLLWCRLENFEGAARWVYIVGLG